MPLPPGSPPDRACAHHLCRGLLQGIKVIKLYDWQQSFINMVQSHRVSELASLRRTALLRAFNMAVMMASPAFVAVAAFATYAATGGTIRASVLFTALAVFSQLRFPLMFYPMAIATLSSARVRVAARRCRPPRASAHMLPRAAVRVAACTAARAAGRCPLIASTAS